MPSVEETQQSSSSTVECAAQYVLVGEKGLEPLTSTMSTSRSNQLSYPPRPPG